MQNKYCLPIIKSSKAEILNSIEQSEPNYGFFEVWLDYIEDFDISFVSDLIAKFPGRIILVFRRQNLEPIKMVVEQRFKILDEASGKDCLVDLDISCQLEDLDYAAKDGLQLNKVVSFHDYERTPDDDGLKAKLDAIKSHNPAIIKLSTFCDTKKDALRLLNLQQELAENNQKHIILGMGENGQITRIFATLWGNELAFVPEAIENESAKGQIPRDKFERIIKELTNGG